MALTRALADGPAGSKIPVRGRPAKSSDTDPERLKTFVHLPSHQRSVLTEFVPSSLFPPDDAPFFKLRLAALELHVQIGS
jgi:hypothetical protein